jgi:hypothetical protein
MLSAFTLRPERSESTHLLGHRDVVEIHVGDEPRVAEHHLGVGFPERDAGRVVVQRFHAGDAGRVGAAETHAPHAHREPQLVRAAGAEALGRARPGGCCGRHQNHHRKDDPSDRIHIRLTPLVHDGSIHFGSRRTQ